jgi:hypothetical protein
MRIKIAPVVLSSVMLLLSACGPAQPLITTVILPKVIIEAQI